MGAPACSLCESDGGALVYHAARFRVVRADEAGFPAFYRVIWNDHKAEFSDLDADERRLCMEAVVAVEQALRQQLQPTKINVASLGNMVAHVHWHVIARFEWDSHFPSPVWAAAQRESPAALCAGVVSHRAATESLMAQKLQVLPP
jgi:diadenosine tetraphosphate (Ap4A) HIT family hydrolase